MRQWSAWHESGYVIGSSQVHVSMNDGHDEMIDEVMSPCRIHSALCNWQQYEFMRMKYA